MRVAYLGPGGTYSQEAAIQKLGVLHQPVFCNSLAEVVAAVVGGRADYSILPIENSTNGVVQPAIDALVANVHNDVQIIDEVAVLVRHQLYSRAAGLDAIQTVYSHPQVWGQTSQWMHTHLPNAKKVNSTSSAQGVQMALSDESGASAALGGPLTSDAQPLVGDCADDAHNTTRFVVLIRPGTLAAQGSGTSNHTVYAVKTKTEINALIKDLGEMPGEVSFLAASPSDAAWRYSYFVQITGASRDEVEARGFLVMGTSSDANVQL